MANQFLDEFFEKIYNHELEQKRHLDSADGLLIGIVGALIGVGAYYLSLIPASSWCVSCIVFWVLTAGFFISLAGSLLACMSSVGVAEDQFMSYVASPKTWSNYLDGLLDFHAIYRKGVEIENEAAIDVARESRKHYIEAGESNRELIIKKHGHQVRAKRCISMAVVFMLASAFPSTFMQLDSAAKAVAPRSSNLKAGVKVSKPERPTSATEHQQPPQKPKPPEIVVVREGDTKAQGSTSDGRTK